MIFFNIMQELNLWNQLKKNNQILFFNKILIILLPFYKIEWATFRYCKSKWRIMPINPITLSERLELYQQAPIINNAQGFHLPVTNQNRSIKGIVEDKKIFNQSHVSDDNKITSKNVISIDATDTTIIFEMLRVFLEEGDIESIAKFLKITRVSKSSESQLAVFINHVIKHALRMPLEEKKLAWVVEILLDTQKYPDFKSMYQNNFNKLGERIIQFEKFEFGTKVLKLMKFHGSVYAENYLSAWINELIRHEHYIRAGQDFLNYSQETEKIPYLMRLPMQMENDKLKNEFKVHFSLNHE